MRTTRVGSSSDRCARSTTAPSELRRVDLLTEPIAADAALLARTARVSTIPSRDFTLTPPTTQSSPRLTPSANRAFAHEAGIAELV